MSKEEEVDSILFQWPEGGSMSAFCPFCGRMISVNGRNRTHQILEIIHDNVSHIVVMERFNTVGVVGDSPSCGS